jgi:hypothetical protein
MYRHSLIVRYVHSRREAYDVLEAFVLYRNVPTSIPNKHPYIKHRELCKVPQIES